LGIQFNVSVNWQRFPSRFIGYTLTHSGIPFKSIEIS
jgi:hypothetical protein